MAYLLGPPDQPQFHPATAQSASGALSAVLLVTMFLQLLDYLPHLGLIVLDLLLGALVWVPLSLNMDLNTGHTSQSVFFCAPLQVGPVPFKIPNSYSLLPGVNTSQTHFNRPMWKIFKGFLSVYDTII